MASMDGDQIDKEILTFLRSPRVDLRCIAMQYMLGLTGSEEGQTFIGGEAGYISAVIALCKDEQSAIAKDAYLSLVNLSTTEVNAKRLCFHPDHPRFMDDLLLYITNAESVHSDIVCMILSNITRNEDCARLALNSMLKDKEHIGFERVIFVFCQNNFNTRQNNLHYLGLFISNLTQIREARFCVMDKKQCVLQRLLPFVEYEESVKRRGGIVGAIKNCCFEYSYHAWLLGEEVDVLPRLLLPLAGGEELDDDDMERLPPELQYLAPDKRREPDADIRRMLLEALTKLCATKAGRAYVKEKNAYVILREAHRAERDVTVSAAAEALIQTLIAEEPEPGMEELHEVEVPEGVAAQLETARAQAEAEAKQENEARAKAEELTPS